MSDLVGKKKLQSDKFWANDFSILFNVDRH